MKNTFYLIVFYILGVFLKKDLSIRKLVVLIFWDPIDYKTKNSNSTNKSFRPSIRNDNSVFLICVCHFFPILHQHNADSIRSRFFILVIKDPPNPHVEWDERHAGWNCYLSFLSSLFYLVNNSCWPGKRHSFHKETAPGGYIFLGCQYGSRRKTKKYTGFISYICGSCVSFEWYFFNLCILGTRLEGVLPWDVWSCLLYTSPSPRD